MFKKNKGDDFTRGVGTDNEILAFNRDHKKGNRREANFIRGIPLTAANLLFGTILSGGVVALK